MVIGPVVIGPQDREAAAGDRPCSSAWDGWFDAPLVDGSLLVNGLPNNSLPNNSLPNNSLPNNSLPNNDLLSCTAHRPPAYISRHWPQLLPDWRCPVEAVIVFLQRSPVPLWGRSPQVERAKALLRHRALTTGRTIAAALAAEGHQTAVFDPKTGLPVGTASGRCLDDVAVACQLLGYDTERNGQCNCLRHPHWGRAVYPSTLLTTAAPHQLERSGLCWVSCSVQADEATLLPTA